MKPRYGVVATCIAVLALVALARFAFLHSKTVADHTAQLQDLTAALLQAPTVYPPVPCSTDTDCVAATPAQCARPVRIGTHYCFDGGCNFVPQPNCDCILGEFFQCPSGTGTCGASSCMTKCQASADGTCHWSPCQYPTPT